MQNRITLVTGAAGGMGRVIARDLATRGASVAVVCRSMDQATELRNELVSVTGNQAIYPMHADLSHLASVRTLAEDFSRRFARLDVLINNAGAHFPERRLSKDGNELHLAVNHLGPFLLTYLLVGKLAAAAPSRVVNVSSASISDTRTLPLGAPRPARLQVDDLQCDRAFSPMDAYARSKLANLMTGYALARKQEPLGVSVQALHPGIVSTGIIADITPPFMRPALGIIKSFLRTPEEGAAGAIHLATGDAIIPATGGYFVDSRPVRSPQQSYDIAVQEEVYRSTCGLVGVERRDTWHGSRPSTADASSTLAEA